MLTCNLTLHRKSKSAREQTKRETAEWRDFVLWSQALRLS